MESKHHSDPSDGVQRDGDDEGAVNNKGLIDWLLSCPAKEWFVPIESEDTDSLRVNTD